MIDSDLLKSARPFGFSMVELLCSIALSLILITGVIATLIGSSASMRSAEQTSRVEERGWQALTTIARDIRAAGFNGCLRSPRFSSTLLNIPSLDAGIQGHMSRDVSASLTQLNDLPGAPADSDVLILHVPKRGVRPLQLKTSMSDSVGELEVTNAPFGVTKGDIALISDCTARSYFLVKDLAGSTIRYETNSRRGTGNEDAALGYTFRSGAEIVPIQTIAYYIRSEIPSAPRSLWRRAGTDRPQKVIEGVETMGLTFGLDETEDGVIDSYYTPDAIRDWKSVQSVNVALLLRSSAEKNARDNSRHLREEGAGASDKAITRWFSSTVFIRNHAF